MPRKTKIFSFTISALAAALVCFEAGASTVNLNLGDSVIIQPNVATTVTCGGPGTPVADCTKAIAVFDGRYKICKKSFSASTCFNNEWSDFKTRSPECVIDAFNTCYATCTESYSSSTCYTNCR